MLMRCPNDEIAQFLEKYAYTSITADETAAAMEAIDWQDYYPVVDEDLDLTGEWRYADADIVDFYLVPSVDAVIKRSAYIDPCRWMIDIEDETAEPRASTECTSGVSEHDKAAEMVDQLRWWAEHCLARESLSLSDRQGYTADMSIKPLHEQILSLGWTVEASTNGSVYYTKDVERLRLSNHEVPTTPERADAAECGRWSWDRCGFQIITCLQSLERCMEELDAFEEQIEDDAAYRESMTPGRGNQ